MTVGGVAGIPGIVVSGMPGPPGMVMSGVPGEPGITVSEVPGLPGVPGVGRHWVADLNLPRSTVRLNRTAAAICFASSESGAASAISNWVPLSSNRSFEELTLTLKSMSVGESGDCAPVV